MARNRYGNIGLIPFNYVEEISPQTGSLSSSTVDAVAVTSPILSSMVVTNANTNANAVAAAATSSTGDINHSLCLSSSSSLTMSSSYSSSSSSNTILTAPNKHQMTNVSTKTTNTATNVKPSMSRSSSLINGPIVHVQSRIPLNSTSTSTSSPPSTIGYHQSNMLPFPPSLVASLSATTGGTGCFWLEPSCFTVKHSWYFPNIDRMTAESILRDSNQDGSFLIRPSTTENRCFTLSLLYRT